MAEILSFVNQKGGVGKTTLAFNFAYYISSKKNPRDGKRYKVLFIDTDPQQSVYNFLMAKEEKLNFIVKSEKTDYEKHFDEFDYVIIDSAGHDSEYNRRIIRMSQKVIVPTVLGILDVQSTYHIIDVFTENKVLGYDIDYYLLFNMVSGKDRIINSMITQIKEDVKDTPVFVLKSYLRHSVDFNKSLIWRKSIFEAEETRSGRAAINLRSIIKEVLGWLGKEEDQDYAMKKRSKKKTVSL